MSFVLANANVDDRNSNISGLNEIDAEVQNIMNGLNKNNDKLCKRDAIKNLFMSLQSQLEAFVNSGD